MWRGNGDREKSKLAIIAGRHNEVRCTEKKVRRITYNKFNRKYVNFLLHMEAESL